MGSFCAFFTLPDVLQPTIKIVMMITTSAWVNFPFIATVLIVIPRMQKVDNKFGT
jgi:hypothetical protein